jgi:hypothetical protein
MMGRFNARRQSKTEATKHRNWMDGAAWFLSDPVRTLEIAASSCFFGEPMYYHRDADDKRPLRRNPNWRLADTDIAYLRETLNALDPQEWRSMTPAEMMESAIDKALAHDPERTLQVLVQLRTEGHIRTTPQVGLVRAAHHEKVRGTGLVRKYAPKILRRADEPAVGLAYHYWRYGKERQYGKDAAIPNSLKKAWRDRLERAKEYELAKYKLSEREVKTVDVVNLVHPRGDAVNKLVRGELKNTGQTWEAILSKEGRSTESWIKALDVMGHMAMLRNLRNFADNKVPESAYLGRLVEGAEKGQQLPFRYYAAYKAVEDRVSGRVLDAIEECLEATLKNVPRFPGRLMALCDNSGSAWGTTTSSMGTMAVASIGNLTSVIAGACADDGHVGIFGDRLETFAIRRKSSIMDQLKQADLIGQGIGGGTENGIWLFWDRAIKNAEHWDHIFVFSDMQAGHGGLYGLDTRAYAAYKWTGTHSIDVAKLINEYRSKVNPNVNVYLVQIAGYQDMILPEFYQRTYILGGWGEGVLRFAGEMARLLDNQ